MEVGYLWKANQVKIYKKSNPIKTMSLKRIKSISFFSRLLLVAAKITPKYLGGKSFFRKFVRRNIGLVYKIQTIRGFKFSGSIGDSVDNRIMVYQDYESALSSIIAREAAGTSGFLDVGCNVGWFSCLVASLPNRPKYIIAVDANSEMIDACSSNLKLNGFNAEVLLRAVGPHKGNVTFHVPRLRHSRASLGRANAEQFGDVISYSIDPWFGQAKSRCSNGRMDGSLTTLELYRC